MLATITVLEAQFERYADLTRFVDALHEHLRDPATVDLDGMFTRRLDGVVVFARGKYKGRPVDEIATTKPDYLEWMRREDFFDDTKAVVSGALGSR